jgi:hypothetical protein
MPKGPIGKATVKAVAAGGPASVGSTWSLANLVFLHMRAASFLYTALPLVYLPAELSTTRAGAADHCFLQNRFQLY